MSMVKNREALKWCIKIVAQFSLCQTYLLYLELKGYSTDLALHFN